MEEELLMYILVNKDLQMSKGKTSAQVAHCVTNYVFDMCLAQLPFMGTDDTKKKWVGFLKWKRNNQKKIVLSAPQKLLEELEKEGYWSIRDKGLTEIPPNSLTAVCLGVNTKSVFYQKIPKLKRLRLL